MEAFKQKGADFVVADTLDELFKGMKKLQPKGVKLDTQELRREIEARDRELDNDFTKDAQVTALRGARKYLGDRLIRVAKPHKFLDPEHRPLIAVKLHVLTRKTLGGMHAAFAILVGLTAMQWRLLNRRVEHAA